MGGVEEVVVVRSWKLESNQNRKRGECVRVYECVGMEEGKKWRGKAAGYGKVG